MLRLLKRSRKSAPPSAVPVAAPEQRRASGSASPVTPIQSSPLHTPSASALESLRSDLGTDSPVQRRDSDEFFASAIQELSGDDFLLSPAKVSVDDINSIQEASPGGRVWAPRSVHGSGASAAGSSSPPESHHAQLQRAHSRSGSGGGSGAISRSLFSASEDDASWLVAAPSANGGALDTAFSMLEDSPPRSASGRAAAGPFGASPSRIPSGPRPSPSPSASANSGRSRIPKPAPNYSSPVKASSGTGGSRIPASRTPSSNASRIPVSPSPSPSQDPEYPVQQYPESPSRLPKGLTDMPQAVQGQPPGPESLPPARHHSDSSDLQPVAQAAEPYVEPAPASPRADVPYSEPARQPSAALPLPVAADPYPAAAQQQQRRQAQAQQQAPAQPQTAGSGGWTGVAVGTKRPAEADADIAAGAEQKSQGRLQQQALQKDKQCCGCCIM